MTDVGAVRLSSEHIAPLGVLRTIPGIDVREVDGIVWLRVRESSDRLQAALRKLPHAEAFLVLDDGQLCRVGTRVPQGRIPDGPWQPVADWLPVRMPRAEFPVHSMETVSLKLVRSFVERVPNLLLTSAELWSNYAVSAPQVRLDRWSFATSSGGDFLIRGRPLPPLRGIQFVEERGIAVPCGWYWSPAIDADVVAGVMGLQPGEVLLWRPDCKAQRIEVDDFVRASRSAVRLSSGGPPDD